MRIITRDDIIETYTKARQRGFSFILSKFNINSIKRTKSAFNNNNIKSANWSIIPNLQKRWNSIVTGDPKMEYQEFVVKKIFNNSKELKLLSIGSGKCKHELKFASYNNFEEVSCMDISDKLLKQAEKNAIEKGYANMKFIAKNLYKYNFPKGYFDIVLFHASLHHFKDIDYLLGAILKKTLKKDGLLIINEYVGPNRIQYSKQQLKSINIALKTIPKKFRQRYNIKLYKNKIYGSGLLRMIIADPSECVNSESIMPTIHKYYNTKHEANLGGNILMPVLKDISHHFIETTKEKKDILNTLFKIEDDYLKSNKSDYVFGVYEKN